MVHYICIFIYTSCVFVEPPSTESYTLSLHDALPICPRRSRIRIQRSPKPPRQPSRSQPASAIPPSQRAFWRTATDRKSTRLNSSHSQISYAVFCLKKKNITITINNVLSYHQIHMTP